jgi:AraC-like DNA-binding protein
MDSLSHLLERFPLRANVFYTGALCGIYDFDPKLKPAHFHCIQSGSVEVIDGEERRTIQGPSVVLMPHAGSHGLVARAGARALCATLRFGTGATSPVIGALPRLVVLPVAEAPNVSSLCELLFDEAGAEREGRQASLDRLCELSVIALLRVCIDRRWVGVGTLAGLSDPRLACGLALMHAQPGRDWSLDELAAQARMSRARFALHFKAVVGVTPGEHLVSCRLAEAQQLLRQGLQLKAVAERVGYGSASALTRAFTRVLGFAPAQWRAGLENGDDAP